MSRIFIDFGKLVFVIAILNSVNFILLPFHLTATAQDEEAFTLGDARIRIERLEKKFEEFEEANSGVSGDSFSVEEKPILEIDTDPVRCRPCADLERDIKSAGDLPVEIKYTRFSSTVIPAFRWTKGGEPVVRTGYTRGSLENLVKTVVADSIEK